MPDRRNEAGDHERFELVDWQLWCLLNFYRVRPDAERSRTPAAAFHYRRAQIVLPQKAGKAPYTAAHICVEAVGPAVFAGWARGGETWDCRDFGCGCGWVHEYEPGEAMAAPWGRFGSSDPLIQITAFSAEQCDNIYDALRPMIDRGPLAIVIPKTGEEFIRLPNGGRIDVVTSSAQSRLGQRVTFVPQDETGVWSKTSGMIRVAETQRRGLAGMGGRAEETTNAWDLAEESVAQRTAETDAKDVFRYHPLAPSALSYGNKAERRKIHRHVYRGCFWIDLDVIEGEAVELLSVDPGQAERFYGNRPTAGGGAAFNPDTWRERADAAKVVPDEALIVLGIDGARGGDALAVIGTEVETGHQFVVGIWERPEHADDSYEHPQAEVDAAVTAAFDRYTVWRAYCDPQHIEVLIDRWAGRWGEDQVVVWRTNRARVTAMACRAYREAMELGDLTHDGDSMFARHVANARRRPTVGVYDEERRPLWTISKDGSMSPRKIDAAMAAVLSWEARGDAIASGASGGEGPRIRVLGRD